MQKNALQRIEEFLTRNRQHRTWKKFVGALACGVVMGTACALILPAVTLEEEPRCGKIEHTHTEACYTGSAVDVPTEAGIQIQEGLVLSCGLEEHSHSAACSEIGLPAALPGQQGAEEPEDRGEIYSVRMDGYLEATDFNVSGSAIRKDDAIEQKLTAYFGPTEDGKSRVITDYRLYQFQLKQDQKDYVQLEDTDVPRWIQVEYTKDKGIPFEEEKDKLYVLNLHEESPDSQETVIKDYTGYVKYSVAGESICTSVAYQTNTPDHPYDASDVIAFVVVREEEEKLEDLGVYPTLEPEDKSRTKWVVYDTGDAATANVKATITLADGKKATENCFPFIRRVEEGEENYPIKEALDNAVGARNDVQCYTIHWVEIKDGHYNLETGMEFGNGKEAEIQLEYLNENIKLGGPAGGRKLKVFALDQSDRTKLVEISDAVKKVDLDEKEGYNGFTFRVTAPCPYVFISKKVEKGYVRDLNLISVQDGSGPFDIQGDLNEKDEVDFPGNDSSDDNKVVRSYDTVVYNFEAFFEARDHRTTQEKVKVFFEVTLRKSATAARFDVNQMLQFDHFGIEYLNDDDDVLMILANDGKYYLPEKNGDGTVKRDEYGFAIADKTQRVYLNSMLNGSQEGSESYKVKSGAVTQQRFVGWKIEEKEAGESVLNGKKEYKAAIEVRNADNGEKFMPTFRMWLEGNEENYGMETTENGTPEPAQPVEKNTIDVETDCPENAVTVSAGTNFNLQLKKNTDMSYKNWFDFTKGTIVEEPTRTRLVELAGLKNNHGKANPAEFVDENGRELDEATKKEYANYRYGRITGYGITIQLYSDTDNNPDVNRAGKGLKGFSLPVGDITFDLNFASKTPEGGEADDFTAILWDYNENVPAHESYSYTYKDPDRKKITTPKDGKGNGGRTIFWDGEIRSPYAKGGGPGWFKGYFDGCYYGGEWTMVDGKEGEIKDLKAMNQIATPTKVKGTGKDTTYHFKISDYDFDFDEHHFPTRDAGNSGDVTGYNTYARGFSAGYVQVLSVFPMVQKLSVAQVGLEVTVSNLSLTTRAGQELKAADNDETKIKHEVNENDNYKNDAVVLYSPGNLTKGNAFNGQVWDSGTKKYREPHAVSEGFLGTDYWTTSYDCSAFAGDKIWIMSYGMMSPGSDNRTKSMNLLQLFDSKALSIRDEPKFYQEYNESFDQPGETTFLYAVDPDYPQGYDTNQDGVLKYMNSVREEDLIYSKNKPDSDGYIEIGSEKIKCVGVLLELRHCDLLSGRYQYLSIPVKVNGDDPSLIGSTVATVNTFRVWSNDLVDDQKQSISWANGEWDKEADGGGKNKLAGYRHPKEVNNDPTDYAGELANPVGYPIRINYEKTEYKDGQRVSGHGAGTLGGNSLLILGYEAHVDIGVTNKTVDQGSGKYTYHQDRNQTVVDYLLKNINTKISALTGQVNKPTTTLYVQARLDLKNADAQRIAVSEDSYRMVLKTEEQVEGQPTEYSISSDPNHPTEIIFFGSDKKEHQISVYAEKATDGNSVKFTVSDAPVGIQIPDIAFQANFSAVSVLRDGAEIETHAYISGQGDHRAYDVAKGNEAAISVYVVLSNGAYLEKKVNVRYIELNGAVKYTVTYTNNGTETINTMYFYDLLPKSGDIRQSYYNGQVGLGDFSVLTSGKNKSSNPVTGEVYYSTVPYEKLQPIVKVFGGKAEGDAIKDMNEEEIKKLLDGTTLYTDGQPYFYKLGEVDKDGKFLVDGYIKYPKDVDEKLKQNPSDEEKNQIISNLMSRITGLYVVVHDLDSGQAVDLKFTVGTSNNQAADLYKNFSICWTPGSGAPITSNMVETSVISRRIAGAVWYDRNLNGIQDDGEPLLKGVEATLFKKQVDPTNQQVTWVECDRDVTGATMDSIVTTGENGEYRFEKLAAGEYIVAFSGDRLKDYTGAASYQVNGKNDAKTNDGMEIGSMASDGLTEEQIKDGRYAYYIKYSNTSDLIPLHSLNEIVSLQNGVEAVDDQDLGVVIAGPKLPMTGGSGTAGYILGGLFLMAGAVLFLVWRRKRHAV